MEAVLAALRATAFPCCCTAAGAASVFFLGGCLNEQARRCMDGFAAGVMLAASIFSLLVPAVESSTGALPSCGGFALGAVGLLVVERAAEGLLHRRGRHSLRVVLAITLHNLPEGMVVGLAAALALSGGPTAAAGAAALAFGIGLQNLPEGAAVSLPLRQSGVGRLRSFAAGVCSGLVEPLGGVLAALVAIWVIGWMPWLLAGAAGVMVACTAQELLPSSATHTDGMVSFLLGFVLMMALDVALG